MVKAVVGGFSPDIAGFGVGCMSGLKPPTHGIPLNKIQTSAGRINKWTRSVKT